MDILRREELDDVKAVMSTKAGRRFVWRILQQANIFTTTFNIEHSIASFNEGQRNMGLMVFMDIMEACPEKYQSMILGVREREERLNERRDD